MNKYIKFLRNFLSINFKNRSILFFPTKNQKDYYDELKKRNKEISLFLKINHELIANLELDKISQIIVDEIVKTFGYSGGIFFLADKKNNRVYSYTVSNTLLIKKAQQLLKKPIKEHYTTIKPVGNKTVEVIISNRIIESEKISDFISPPVNKNVANLIQKITRVKFLITVPVVSKGECIGALTFAISKHKEDISDRERNLILTFADQIGMAVYNAQLFEQIQTQVKQLKEKTEDMGSLLEVAKIATSSLETRKITQEIVDSVPDKLGYLGYLGSILVLYNPKTRSIYTYCITESEIVKRAKKLLDRPFEEHLESIDGRDNFTTRTVKTKEAHIGNKLEDFIFPTVNKRVCGLIQKLVGAKSFISIPVFAGGKVMGAIIFVAAKPQEEIIQRDKDVLMGFSSHIGTAIENTQLFEQAEGQMKELLKLNSDLGRVNQKLKDLLSMKNDFLHIVSHQLRTPLTAMRGFISMWNEGDFDALPADKMAEIKSRIVNNSERLNNIVNDMVMAMESEGELKADFQLVDLKKLLAGNIEMLKPSFEKKGLYLKYKETAKNIPAIEADEKLLLNVFMNLIDNAEKYTDKGGLTIKVCQDRDDNVKVCFIDTGIGLSKDDKKILFKKFSRGAKSNYINPNGTGLGLFIIKQIIRKHHGEIKAASKGAGKGTTFTVTLPVGQGG